LFVVDGVAVHAGRAQLTNRVSIDAAVEFMVGPLCAIAVPHPGSPAR